MAYTYSIDDPAKNSKRMAASRWWSSSTCCSFMFWPLGSARRSSRWFSEPVETRLIEELPDQEDEPPPPPPEIETPAAVRAAARDLDRHPGGHRPDYRHQQRDAERPVAAPPPLAAPKPVERNVGQDPAVHSGTRGAASPARVPARVASCRRGGDGAAAGVRARQRPRRRGEPSPKSSGFPKLDDAAIKEVQRNWRFVPGKEDGKPVSMWHTFAVTFRLTD